MKTRPTKQKDGFPYPPFAEYRMRHNVANDMLRVVKWAAKATDDDFSRVFALQTRPLIALIFACSAIEGYTNFVGQSVLHDWLEFSKGQTPDQKRRPASKIRSRRFTI